MSDARPKLTNGRRAVAFGIALSSTATALGGAVLLLGGPGPASAPLIAQAPTAPLPKPPADGVMGFVVDTFAPPVIQGKDACPRGPALKLREAYLQSLPAEEKARLSKKENEPELTKRWHAAAFGPNETNICSQPDMFDRPLQYTVESPHAWGMNLDGDATGKGAGDDTCTHENFTTPTGEGGIDNQEYRAMGCQLEWRGIDGQSTDQEIGLRQFLASGEWTQVILLRGVDSLSNDDDVEVIYANTPDRPAVDSKGNFLRGESFTISDAPPRNRNVLRGKIVNGVLTTEPADIRLTQTWGQGRTRDVRGHRTKWDYRKARLQLRFQTDGSVMGMLAGYRPVFDVISAETLGGAGSALAAGLDCSSRLATLKKMADGLRDPKTGKCTGVSGAMRIRAVPAFVNDVPPQRTAAR